MTWNDTVLAHPQLSPTDKLIFHLLARAGSHAVAQRRQVARLLRQTKRNIDKSLGRLAAFGFDPAENCSSQAGSGENSSSQTRTTVLKNTPSPDAPTRTLWSSSSEEDVLVKASTPPPPSLGGAGGEEVPAEFLVEMEGIWKAIAPQEREAPRDWFRALHREFGSQIPLMVFHQFAQSQRTLQHLRHPPSYKSYFTRCCHRAREEGTTQPRPGRAAPAPAHALTAADYHLSDFFTPAPAQTWPQAN